MCLLIQTCSSGISVSIEILHVHQNLVLVCDIVTYESVWKHSRVNLQVLASSFTNTHEVVCKYSWVDTRVFSSSALMTFDLHVANASPGSNHTCLSLILSYDIVGDPGRLHSFVNLRLSISLICIKAFKNFRHWTVAQAPKRLGQNQGIGSESHFVNNVSAQLGQFISVYF